MTLSDRGAYEMMRLCVLTMAVLLSAGCTRDVDLMRSQRDLQDARVSALLKTFELAMRTNPETLVAFVDDDLAEAFRSQATKWKVEAIGEMRSGGKGEYVSRTGFRGFKFLLSETEMTATKVVFHVRVEAAPKLIEVWEVTVIRIGDRWGIESAKHLWSS